MSTAPGRGFQWGGQNALFNSPQGAQWSGGDVYERGQRGIRARGIAYGAGASSPTPGARFGPGAGAWGGSWDGPPDPSVADLIDVDGFALVLEDPSGSDRLAFSPDEPRYRGVKSVQWTNEVNAMASWNATVPAFPKLFGFSFADVTLAYDGERRFHGVFLPVRESEFGDGEYQLSGFGPLWWATHGDIKVHYSDIPAWYAIEDIWLRVAQATEGRVRGEVVRPPYQHVMGHRIPAEGVDWEGTPVEVLQQAHGYAGMAWSFDRTDPAAVAQSFVPGEELRDVHWRPTDVKPSISPEGYHNQVTVYGSAVPGVAKPYVEREDRYSATVTAPEAEIQQVTNGLILERTEIESELGSDQACRARANTLLAEDRGKYTIGGSLTVTPDVRRMVPGYTYRIEQFDQAAPEVFEPVWATLRKVTESYGPEKATVSLSFEDESGVVQHIRNDLLPDMAPRTVERRDVQMDQANPNYTSPDENRVYRAGGGIAGSGAAGVTFWDVTNQ